MTRFDTGFRKLAHVCQMDREKRLFFFAEGFPIILCSARNYRNAALRIKDNSREARILNGYATEEAAKILMLMDAVRCPESIRDKYLPKICKQFYQHHVRLVYAEACSVTGYDVSGLQTEFVDFMRKSHRIEGPGAPIVPQWELWEREANLYADVACTDDGTPYWHSPLDNDSWEDFIPALEVVNAMSAFGFFTPRGVTVTSDIWEKAIFTRDNDTDAQNIPQHDHLVYETLERLCNEGLTEAHMTNIHEQTVQRFWQLPMYDLDFSPIQVQPSDLKKELYANELLDAGYSLEEINVMLETADF